MRSALLLYNNMEAGWLTQYNDGSFTLRYADEWVLDSSKPSLSVSLPKSQIEFHAKHLFPFFFNMIPEGINKLAICKKKNIDADDYFGLLLEVANYDTIGAVRVIKQSYTG